jgi:hypothetical protein
MRVPSTKTKRAEVAANRSSDVIDRINQKIDKLANTPAMRANMMKDVAADKCSVLAIVEITNGGMNWMEKAVSEKEDPAPSTRPVNGSLRRLLPWSNALRYPE